MVKLLRNLFSVVVASFVVMFFNEVLFGEAVSFLLSFCVCLLSNVVLSTVGHVIIVPYSQSSSTKIGLVYVFVLWGLLTLLVNSIVIYCVLNMKGV